MFKWIFNKILKFYSWIFLLSICIFSTTYSIQADPLTTKQLEKEIAELKDQLHELLIEKATPSANPDIIGKDWFIAFDFFYWYSRVNQIDFAYYNHNDQALSIQGKTKNIHFDWAPGVRVGIGRNIDHESWDLYFYYTYYQNRFSGSAHAGFGDTLVPLRGVIVQNTAIGRAKSNLVLDFYNIDLELGRYYYISDQLSLRPFVGLKNAWVDLRQSTRYTHGALQNNSVYINDKSDFWGVGLQGGINSRWHLGSHFSFNGLFGAAILYGLFDIEHSEKHSLSKHYAIKLNDDKHQFIPTMQWRFGMSWGSFVREQNNYITIHLSYEGMYWFRLNKMLNVQESSPGFLKYSNFSEDLAMQGLSLGARLYF